MTSRGSSGWAAATRAVHAGRPDRVPGAGVNVGIDLNSTYLHPCDLPYGRMGNATWSALEEALGELDAGVATVFASGMAAATAIVDLLPPQAHLLVSRSAYQGVREMLEYRRSQGLLTLEWLDDRDPASAGPDVMARADALWLESIGNPLMHCPDLPAVIAAAREHGAMVIVDSTFATPLRQRPLSLGADVVLHSVTKVLSGHSDVLLGAVICADPELAQRARDTRRICGAIPGPLETYLALRGLRTLSVRLDRAEATAQTLVQRLSEHPRVTSVSYPGFGFMLAFETTGTAAEAEQVCAGLELISNATSLGGVESLIERRARWAGDAQVAGPTLLRFSAGLEDVEDLWADLSGALDRLRPGANH